LFPSGPFGYPSSDGFDLDSGQGSAGLRRRHAGSLRGAADARQKTTCRGITGHNDLVAAAIGEQTLSSIQPQAGKAVFFVRPMTGEAIIGQNRTHIAIEINGRGCGQAHAGDTERQEQTDSQISPPCRYHCEPYLTRMAGLPN
jgi:hypothetical protein